MLQLLLGGLAPLVWRGGLQACLHTCIHTYTCTQACIQAYIQTHMQAICIHAYMHTYMHTYTYTTYTYACLHACRSNDAILVDSDDESCRATVHDPPSPPPANPFASSPVSAVFSPLALSPSSSVVFSPVPPSSQIFSPTPSVVAEFVAPPPLPGSWMPPPLPPPLAVVEPQQPPHPLQLVDGDEGIGPMRWPVNKAATLGPMGEDPFHVARWQGTHLPKLEVASSSGQWRQVFP